MVRPLKEQLSATRMSLQGRQNVKNIGGDKTFLFDCLVWTPLKGDLSILFGDIDDVFSILGQNISTTLLRQWGFWQCLPFRVPFRGKHCQHPVAVMGVVNIFRLRHATNNLFLNHAFKTKSSHS